LIIAEAVAEAVKAAEKQAGDIKGFMDLSTEMAEDEGKVQGQKAGRVAGEKGNLSPCFCSKGSKAIKHKEHLKLYKNTSLDKSNTPNFGTIFKSLLSQLYPYN
jgi:hypothetical protein